MAAIELDAVGTALDDFVDDAVAALAPGGGFARQADGAGGAVAIGHLAQFDALGAQHHRALADHGVAVEHRYLALQVEAGAAFGLDDDGLAAVGLLGLGVTKHRPPEERADEWKRGGGQHEFGTDLAGNSIRKWGHWRVPRAAECQLCSKSARAFSARPGALPPGLSRPGARARAGPHPTAPGG